MEPALSKHTCRNAEMCLKRDSGKMSTSEPNINGPRVAVSQPTAGDITMPPTKSPTNIM